MSQGAGSVYISCMRDYGRAHIVHVLPQHYPVISLAPRCTTRDIAADSTGVTQIRHTVVTNLNDTLLICIWYVCAARGGYCATPTRGSKDALPMLDRPVVPALLVQHVALHVFEIEPLTTFFCIRRDCV
jgi:hypothetical protein